jgi:hypothetical protein
MKLDSKRRMNVFTGTKLCKETALQTAKLMGI